MAALKAIETVYNGYRFRSRLEARWAVFFDTLEIPYEYEREGFQLGRMWYLPDFYLPEGPWYPTSEQERLPACWVEIKPTLPGTRDVECVRRLATALSDEYVYLVVGQPYVAAAQFHYIAYRVIPSLPKLFVPELWRQCLGCHAIDLGPHEHDDCVCEDDCAGERSYHSIQLDHAYQRARQARFEHGRSGN